MHIHIHIHMHIHMHMYIYYSAIRADVVCVADGGHSLRPHTLVAQGRIH
jgi:hypothetical protein